MKAAAFDYIRPRDLAEATDALAKHDGAKLLAGGQSLGPMLNLRLARPDLLVDISRLAELKRFEQLEKSWQIGAAVTHAQLEDAVERLRSTLLVSEVAGGIAYRSVRNRGTMGGSLAHADPAADWPLALAVLGATIHTRRSGAQARAIGADNFMIAAFTTDLQQDEIIEFIDIPKRSNAARYGYFKFCRKTGEFPEASAAVVIDPEEDIARIFVGALSGAPKPLPELARAVAKDGPAAASDDDIMAAVSALVPEADPVEIRLHGTSVQRAIQRAFRQ